MMMTRHAPMLDFASSILYLDRAGRSEPARAMRLAI